LSAARVGVRGGALSAARLGVRDLAVSARPAPRLGVGVAFALGLGALASVGAVGCKRNKPPALTRVWLGPSHGCGVTKGGELECWGANDAGQLGDGATVSQPRPVRITVGVAPTELALGARHTCGLFTDIVRCWGDGTQGQLAPSAASSTASADPKVRPTADGHDTILASATAIAAGGDRTCAITLGGVRCWGDGRPVPYEPPAFNGRASALAVGPTHVCAAFLEPPMVKCSGADERSQSGGGKPLLVGATIVSLTAGGRHSCALVDDGTVHCWGANDKGQLGDGTTTDSRTTNLVNGLPPASEVRAGTSHTCARLRDKTVACWGDNHAHQLVTGTGEGSSRPTPVQGLLGVVELVVAGDSSCARLGDGSVRCWGANGSGQLGDGTTADHDVPMPLHAPIAK
jgi:alpha-tubulin suppressor-like RCC1 family protein